MTKQQKKFLQGLLARLDAILEEEHQLFMEEHPFLSQGGPAKIISLPAEREKRRIQAERERVMVTRALEKFNKEVFPPLPPTQGNLC